MICLYVALPTKLLHNSRQKPSLICLYLLFTLMKPVLALNYCMILLNLCLKSLMFYTVITKVMASALKQPGICRIFFSSPFKGMEGEREEFTSRYWPQIDSYCKHKGVQFVPVDMRWGITTESSANNQTINICLREIDRSDIFVGFYGQVFLCISVQHNCCVVFHAIL